MISSTESYKTIINHEYFVITPEISINKNYKEKYGNIYMNNDTEYSSGDNKLIDNDTLINNIKNISN